MTTGVMGLTKIQRKVAASLFIVRPAVIPGSRVIVDDGERKRWYDKVVNAMKANKVKDKDITEFCDIAGVPD